MLGETHDSLPRGAARRALLAAPAALYRWRLGWLLGRRFLTLTYRWRRTGQLRHAVVEVIRFDPAIQESVVLSAFGPTAAWYLRLREAPPVCVQQGRRRYRPVHRFPDHAEAVEIAAELCRKHPLEARLAPPVFRALGATGVCGPAGAREWFASLPMVAARPCGDPDGDSVAT
jgi:hypothetical protein